MTSRRRFLGTGGAAALGLALPRVELAPSLDLVVRGATVFDGTGAPGFAADIGVVGDTIAALGAIPRQQARRAIDAPGLAVAPGFIDIHTHSDPGILAYPTADSRVLQGVTTELAGNCGGSAAPLVGQGLEERRRDLEREGLEVDWTGVASYFTRLERTRLSVNQALLLGQGTLRTNAVGPVDRPLTLDQLRAVVRAVEEGLDEGAFGLSTGLEYTPGRYTPTDEIVELARVVARRGGLYASHIRNEEAALLEAVDEAIEIGRRTGVRVQISHLKAAGRSHWAKQRGALDLIEAARSDGVEVRADAYPYTAYSTGLTIFLGDWALDGGTGPMMARLRDPQSRARIRAELPARLASDPGDPELVVIASVRGEGNRALVGQSLAAVGGRWKMDPLDALLRLVEEEEGAVSYIGHAMSEANVEMVLAHPLVMIGSDGRSMARRGRAAETRPHPRSYGAFPRVLARYCRERRLFDLPTAVRKMTSLPADQLGLADRGRIARGKKADLVVFDPASVRDDATFEDPHRHPAGIGHVVVNGVPVVEGGAHTGSRPGRPLRKA